MNEQNSYTEHVDDADLDLFYGFFDSVMKESNMHDDDAEAPLVGKIAEWAPEPFEEFIVGLPSQEQGKHYGLSPFSQLLPATINQHPENKKGAGVGFVLGLTVYAAIMLSAYSLSSDSEPTMTTATQAHIEKIEQGLSAVEAKVETVQLLKQQVTAMESRLQELSERVAFRPAYPSEATAAGVASSVATTASITTNPEPATQPKSVRRLLPASVSESESALVDASASSEVALSKHSAPWVVNLASSRSSLKAATELARIQALGIDARAVVIYVKEKPWTRIRVVGFVSKNEARSAMHSLQTKTGLQSIWIGKE